ncbi:MAG TPA: DUF3087 domain-containing protein [Gammaproteobacteria bacterium]|nr:DUF3087 domain-containing protein [Gammaproteobacteria bacterium]
MQLQEIDKQTYRKNLNRLIVILILTLAIGSLAISQLMIYLFTDRVGSHFSLNLLGSFLTLAAIAWALNRYRNHPAMREIVYVWELKQELNRIYRKLRKVKAGVAAGDRNAMIILYFSYLGSKQLYTLDDNTLTMDELNKSLQELEETIAAHGYKISIEDYHPDLLKQIR